MSDPAAPAEPAERTRLGAAVALILLAALGYGFHTVLAAASYAYDTDAMTVLLFRSLFTVVVLYLFLRLRRTEPWLRGRALVHGLLLGVLLAAMAQAMLTAIKFISPALMILIFYMFPMIVAAISHATGAHRITIVNIAVMLAAFAGVAVALGASPEGLDWRGVALAVFASFAVAINILGSASLMRSADSIVVTFMMSVGMLGVFLVANLVRGDLQLPNAPAGWWPFAGTVVAYLIASVSFYVAIRRLGPPRVAIAMNVEPIGTIALSALILGDVLTGAQYLGAAIVVVAISVNAYVDFRRSRRLAAAANG